MADFALWATACETAFWPAGTFTQAYQANRRAAIEDLVDADPVAAWVCLPTVWSATSARTNHTLGTHATLSRLLQELCSIHQLTIGSFTQTQGMNWQSVTSELTMLLVACLRTWD